MQRTHTRAAIIEFGGHFEIQYSQLRFLSESAFEVFMVAGERYAGFGARFVDERHRYVLPAVRSRADMLREVRALHRYLEEQGVGTAVISSYSGDMVKLFMLLKPRGLRVFGVIHGLEKLTRSAWVRLLSRRVQGYFVLNDFLLEHCPATIGPVTSTYTIFYPPYPRVDIGKEDGAFHVVIPGQLEYKRRNYPALLAELADDLDPSVRFVLLGSSAHAGGDGEDFRGRIPERHRDRFTLFESFVDETLFHSHIAAADLIMPLLGGRQRYYTEAISGTVNLAFGYHVPMLVEEELFFIEDMRVSAFPYAEGEMTATLNALVADRDRRARKAEDMASFPKFQFDVQRERYVSFIQPG